MGKKIVFLIRSTPYRDLNNYEAMRTSIALYDHEVTVVWMGDGVFYPLKCSDKSNAQPILRLFKDLNIRLLVDSDELALRGYSSQDIIAEAEPVPHDEVVAALVQADSVLSF
jgi:sulfur relay (sulfurtransferase) DsrF/TusC family protein